MGRERKSKIQNLKFCLGVLLLLGLLGPLPVAASQKLPGGYSPFAYPVAPPPAQPLAQAAATATPAPAPTPAPATGGLTLDRFAVGFVLIVVGTLGAALAVLGLRRARRLRDATLSGKAPPSHRN